MNTPTFRGRGDIPGYPPTAHDGLPFRDPRGYEADPELARAVNIALALQKPLLVTGEPGTGKTELAYRVAAELGLVLLRFDTKSSSTAHDLFYQFDAVGRLAEAQLAAFTHQPVPSPAQCLQLKALGDAIARTHDPAIVRQRLGLARHEAPQRSLVLIDEIDKAPRDFPNDLLNQIENLEFAAHEVGMHEPLRAVREQDGVVLTPVVILTSNSEKQLPEPFLRRCIYHHIEFPGAAQLTRILRKRLQPGDNAGNASPTDVAGFVEWILPVRQDTTLEKRPSTAEMLDALRALPAEARGAAMGKSPLPDHALDALRDVLGTLFKSRAGLATVRDRYTRSAAR